MLGERFWLSRIISVCWIISSLISWHIMADGRIVKSGGADLALEVEKNGYEDLLVDARVAG